MTFETPNESITANGTRWLEAYDIKQPGYQYVGIMGYYVLMNNCACFTYNIRISTDSKVRFAVKNVSNTNGNVGISFDVLYFSS